MDSPDNLHNRLKSSHEISLLVKGDEETTMNIIKSVPHVLNVRINKRNHDQIEYIVQTEKEVDVRSELASSIVKSRRKCSLLELRSIAMSLEDIFLQLVTQEEVN